MASRHESGGITLSNNPCALLQASHSFIEQLQQSIFCRENSWHADTGVYRGDCSGLILTLLEQSHPLQLQALQREQQSQRPKAFQVFDWLEQAPPGIQLYQSFAGIKPGQMIGWRKVNPPKSGDSGHLAIILKVGTQQGRTLDIQVLDCSKQAHDKDNRSRPGVACGWMQLTADDEGKINGYIWSSKLSKAKRTKVLVAELG